jgi:23S rRNA (cytosine1962-C5)-methyltransferase
MQFQDSTPPCVLHEDEHLLVVNKPAGMNTHSPAPYAGEGVYDWLRHRQPRWSQLAIIHRLDKETSGVLVFGKTPQANRSLTGQFTRRCVAKKYVLLTDRTPAKREFVVKSNIARAGERYVSSRQGEVAETRFCVSDFNSGIANLNCLEAEPVTGRTHQIRVHAAESGFPILGDVLYGGAAFPRVCLHATELRLKHPGDNREILFRAPVEFSSDPRAFLRRGVIDPEQTNAYRFVHGASDGWPGWYVDRLGEFLLSQSEQPLAKNQLGALRSWMQDRSDPATGAAILRGVYHKILDRQVRRAGVAAASPQRVLGDEAPERFVIQENGVAFELSFLEGYSVGLFLDQRDNRRRFLSGHVAAGFELPVAKGPKLNPLNRPQVLNAFAYTCGFSVCAANAGAQTTSLDLSKKYLEWGKRNFALNEIDAAEHDFIFGDAFDWLRRLAKKGRLFDTVVLDPPTFSQSKETGVFRVEKDLGRLVAAALPLIKSEGVLFASANAANWMPEAFLENVIGAVMDAKRRVLQQHYVPQPPDFPISRMEPSHLKTLWLRIS